MQEKSPYMQCLGLLGAYVQVRDRVSDTVRVRVRASVTIGYIRRFRPIQLLRPAGNWISMC